MGFRICFPLLVTGRFRRWFCIDIPVAWDPFWRIPDPGPQFQVDGKTPLWAQDAMALASVRALIPGVSKEVARHLEVASRGMLESIEKQLPEGAKTSFTKQARAKTR